MILQSSEGFYTNGNIIPIIDNNNKLYWNISNLSTRLWLSLEEIIVLQKQISYLRENWQVVSNVTFSDLDDTLLSRIPQLEEDQFAMARWPSGNEVVRSIWFKQFIKKYYSKDLVVKEIIDKTNFILTAWEVDIQEAKIQRTGLDIFDTMVVPKHSLKPKELLYFLLFKLQKLPQTITIFDDRVDQLSEQLSSISEFLNNWIITHKVLLDVDFPNQVKSISTDIYSSGDNLKKAA